jgi:hypothetical protein
LKEALKDSDKFMDGSNEHMFDDKKGRFDAMNALASYSFQMYEVELQKVHGDETNTEVEVEEMQKKSFEKA